MSQDKDNQNEDANSSGTNSSASNQASANSNATNLEDNKLKESKSKKSIKNIFNKTNKHWDTKEFKDAPRSHKNIILTLVIGAVAGGVLTYGTTQMTNNAHIPGNIIQAKHYKLSSKDAFNYLIKNQSNQQSVLGYAMNQILLKQFNGGSDYKLKAHQKMNSVIKQFGTQATFDQALASKNTSEAEYLLSIENLLMIKDQIKNNYQPSESAVKNAYNQMGDTYDISGVVVAPANANIKSSLTSAKAYAEKLKKQGKNLDANKAAKSSTKLYNVAGLAGQDGTVIKNVSTNNTSNMPANLLNQLKGKKAGDIVYQNSQYGYYIVKIDKVYPKGSFNNEKSKVIGQLKTAASNDSNKQLEFSAKLLKDNGLKSNDSDIQNLINTTLNKAM